MAAAILMCTMVVLWGRVLLSGRHGPRQAQAAEETSAGQTVVEKAVVAAQFRPIALECLEGRNDVLTADLFSAERWQAFDFTGAGQPAKEAEPADRTAKDRKSLADLDAAAKELLVEAVIQSADGSGMQAFIAGKVLTVGQSLSVERAGQVYELIVTEITLRHVVLSRGTYSICLKLTGSHEQ